MNPDLFTGPGMRSALATRDISAVYRLLVEHGVRQRTIAALTGQTPSEVCEIIKGHRVQAYDVLVRICTGFGIPRGWMGLAHDGDSEPEPAGEVDEDTEHRALVAAAGVALFRGATAGGAAAHPRRSRDSYPVAYPGQRIRRGSDPQHDS